MDQEKPEGRRKSYFASAFSYISRTNRDNIRRQDKDSKQKTEYSIAIDFDEKRRGAEVKVPRAVAVQHARARSRLLMCTDASTPDMTKKKKCFSKERTTETNIAGIVVIHDAETSFICPGHLERRQRSHRAKGNGFVGKRGMLTWQYIATKSSLE